jgi:hypothetical protein
VDQAGCVQCHLKWLTSVETLAELGQRGTLRDVSEFYEQIVRKRHARDRGSGLEIAVKNLRNISNLNHSSNVASIFACGAHVKPKECVI